MSEKMQSKTTHIEYCIHNIRYKISTQESWRLFHNKKFSEEVYYIPFFKLQSTKYSYVFIYDNTLTGTDFNATNFLRHNLNESHHHCVHCFYINEVFKIQSEVKQVLRFPQQGGSGLASSGIWCHVLSDLQILDDKGTMLLHIIRNWLSSDDTSYLRIAYFNTKSQMQNFSDL